LFYITAVNNNNATPETSTPSNQLKDMTVNDNWELSTRKDGSHGDKIPTPIGAPSTPDQEIPAAPSELNDLAENTFKEEDTTPNERPTIVSLILGD
jgi:hypothetical protein